MKFIRLNKDTVRCILSSEDIKEQGLNLNDFIEQNQNAANFIHKIIERASEEIGYEVKNGMLTLRVMQMPGDKISITISDLTPEDAEKAEFTDKMDLLFRRLSELEQLKRMIDEGETDLEALPDGSSETETKNALSATSSILAFETLDQISDFAKGISYGRPIDSDLLKKGKAYFLRITRGNMAENSYAKICFLAVDFGGSLVNNEITEAYLAEHGEVLIRKNALKVMKKI